jgi:lysine N6-hydroxylase
MNIYRRLYHINFNEKNKKNIFLLPSHKLFFIESKPKNYIIHIQDLENNTIKKLIVDKIILCTGYNYTLPPCLSELNKLIRYKDKNFIVDKSYRLNWEGMNNASIYIQNGARHSHGVADPNLSLMAYRSAIILNQINTTPLYPDINGESFIDWTFGLEQNEL